MPSHFTRRHCPKCISAPFLVSSLGMPPTPKPTGFGTLLLLAFSTPITSPSLNT